MFSIKDDRVASRKKMVAFKSFGHPRKCPQKFTDKKNSFIIRIFIINIPLEQSVCFT